MGQNNAFFFSKKSKNEINTVTQRGDMEIYLIRHGETDYNLQGIVQGSSVNTSLNQTGKTQAQKFFEAYQNTHFDKVYTSTLNRAIESVQGFINKGISWEKHDALNEINWGNSDGQKVNIKEHAEYMNTLKLWQNGEYHMRMPGGESPLDVKNRQTQFLNLLQNVPLQRVLICMHGRAMRIFLCNLLNLNLNQMEGFEHSNLCLYTLKREDSKFKIIKPNCTLHLK